MPNPKHYRGDQKKRIPAVERQRHALELRLTGKGYQEIADELGYRDPTGAWRAVKAALTATLREPADELRVMEAERLDRLLMGHWDKAKGGNVRSLEGVLRLMDRRAKLLGLDKVTPKQEQPPDRAAIPGLADWLASKMDEWEDMQAQTRADDSDADGGGPDSGDPGESAPDA